MELRSYFTDTLRKIEDENYKDLELSLPPKPEYFNWVEEIFYPLNVQRHGEKDALIWKHKTTKKYSFNDVYTSCNQLLNLLRRHGVKEGQVIYTMLPLVPENWYSFLAGIKGGFIIMPTATNLVTKDLIYRFDTLTPDVMIAHSDFADEIDQAERQSDKSIKLKIIVGGQRAGWINFDEVWQEAKEASPAKTKSDTPFLYFFTSGTTGLPKIVVHSHFTYPVGHLSTLSWLGCTHEDIHYNISSPGWAKFAWSSFFAPWNSGAAILAYQADKFDPKDQLHTMEELGVSTFCGSPTVIRLLIQEDLSDYKLKLRSCCAAGEPLNPDVIDKWYKGTGVTIRDGYGQTETTALIANLKGQQLKPGSLGKPTFLYDIGIYDDQGNEVPHLEEGVICVKTDQKKNNGLFLEYLNDQDRMAHAFKHDLYYTGDKAYKDQDGYVWFIGRNDDVIKASAYRIGPFEVESVLIEHQDIIESAVVASPHPIRGYAVKAFIILRDVVEPQEQLAQELFSFCGERLAKYKIPRIIEFSTTLPKTISGKIRRIELRANEAVSKQHKEIRKHEYFHDKY